MLTVDIGNTRLKWGVWGNDDLTATGSCEHHSRFDNLFFDEYFPRVSDGNEIIVSNVAGKDAENSLTQWVDKQGETKIHFMQVQQQCCGVTNGYSDPSQHGVDRWVALLGARSFCKTAVCVIDMGTAVTVDFMNDDGVHEGGVIMPGLAMMQSSLQNNTSNISIDINEHDVDTNPFAKDTTQAIQSGTLNLLRAGIQDICERAVGQYGENISIFLTGGLAERMMPLLSSPYISFEPHLVLKGLHFAAKN